MHLRHACSFGNVLLALLVAAPAGAQTFTKITSGNPIATTPVPLTAQFTGCAWADYDADGDQDLYIVQEGLFRNDGAGGFTLLSTVPVDHANAIGCSWADADNDGDLDLYVSGGSPGGSRYYRNDGGDNFSQATTGILGDTEGNMGWGCAWSDWDLDGRTDVVIAAAFGFIGITTPNHLLHNEGGGTFTRVDTSAVCQVTGPYTIPTWNDVDDDGDPDLFIASGPANGTTAADFLYENRRAAPGETFLRRVLTGALATDAHDAQVFNWADIDSDGDLDVYVTNYGGATGIANNLYRNDAGTFVKLTGIQAGTIVNDAGHSLSSVWADFDNDGDLDCLVTNDGPELSLYYLNNGSGFFTSQSTSALRTTGPRYGAAAADYDGDGDLDVYVHGTANRRGFYRNELNATSTNGWLDVRCQGTISNRAALGTRVQVIATIGGIRRRQIQQVSAQNSFGGHNALELHFGLGNASVADSVIVAFPSGIRQVLTGVAIKQRITVIEDAATEAVASLISSEVAAGRVRLAWQLGDCDDTRATVLRQRGAGEWNTVGTSTIDGTRRVEFEDLDVAPGATYTYELEVSDGGEERRIGRAVVTVPAAGDVGLQWLADPAATGRLAVQLSLPRGGDAQLAVIDAAGRVLERRALTGLAAGRTTVELGRAEFSPGVYWVRLTHGAEIRAVRALVLR